MKTQPENSNTAHSLYALYETLPDTVQREFLSELVQKKRQELEDLSFYLDCKQAKDENEFLDDNEAQAFIESLTQ
ncbi:MAG: hypothetical protein Q8Q54_06225 [Methylococcales bacterium]|jgi:hypothetical protein|nr:hypothetical protein [Methylococcales bacterium]MDP3332756.1 hypothetical protein [Methylococcaceae bacterium]MDP3838500.1 hypothetical protein [Methylococcales bacterium]